MVVTGRKLCTLSECTNTLPTFVSLSTVHVDCHHWWSFTHEIWSQINGRFSCIWVFVRQVISAWGDQLYLHVQIDNDWFSTMRVYLKEWKLPCEIIPSTCAYSRYKRTPWYCWICEAVKVWTFCVVIPEDIRKLKLKNADSFLHRELCIFVVGMHHGYQIYPLQSVVMALPAIR